MYEKARKDNRMFFAARDYTPFSFRYLAYGQQRAICTPIRRGKEH
jgi:hypothetical protein